MATSPLRSRGVPMVKKGHNGYITCAFSGVPIVGKDQNACITRAFLGGPHGGEGSKWLRHLCLLHSGHSVRT